MKVTALALTALCAFEHAHANTLRKHSVPVQDSAVDEDTEWFDRMVQEVTSVSTDAPVPAPTSAPVTPATPVPGATPAPTAAPTSAPTASPTSAATSAPTASPTSATTSAPTASPTSTSTSAPTASPTSADTASPTSTPTLAPTGVCISDVQLACTFSNDGVATNCEELPPANPVSCSQEVLYTVEACNAGTDELTLFDLSFNFNGDISDLLVNGTEAILPGECYEDAVTEIVNLCAPMEYFASATMNATDPVTNEPFPCEDVDEVTFTYTPPTPQPTPSPSPMPTNPAPPPTDTCSLGVAVEPECPSIECAFDRCRERPFRMEFRVDPRVCNESVLRRCPGVDPDSCVCDRNITLLEEDWPEQKFFCEDFAGGPIDTAGEYFIRAYPERSNEIIYFEGILSSGDRFNMTEPTLTRVDANTFLEIYDVVNGTEGELLQQVLFHSSCSEQLFLLDIFGSFQLVEFESDSQLVGFAINPTVSFALTVAVETDELVLDSLALAVFSAEPVLPSQTVIFNVTDVEIPPAFSAETEINLIPNQDFTVITTVTGEINGAVCSDISQQVINCPANAEPTL